MLQQSLIQKDESKLKIKNLKEIYDNIKEYKEEIKNIEDKDTIKSIKSLSGSMAIKIKEYLNMFQKFQDEKQRENNSKFKTTTTTPSPTKKKKKPYSPKVGSPTRLILLVLYKLTINAEDKEKYFEMKDIKESDYWKEFHSKKENFYTSIVPLKTNNYIEELSTPRRFRITNEGFEQGKLISDEFFGVSSSTSSSQMTKEIKKEKESTTNNISTGSPTLIDDDDDEEEEEEENILPIVSDKENEDELSDFENLCTQEDIDIENLCTQEELNDTKSDEDIIQILDDNEVILIDTQDSQDDFDLKIIEKKEENEKEKKMIEDELKKNDDKNNIVSQNINQKNGIELIKSDVSIKLLNKPNEISNQIDLQKKEIKKQKMKNNNTFQFQPRLLLPKNNQYFIDIQNPYLKSVSSSCSCPVYFLFSSKLPSCSFNLISPNG